ncbi:TRAP transporter substrate-binding protein DctP [Rhodococcus rhodochrous]|uniref:TRAP transporter substrate-binding protein DctP n=1 Tax=Rhodococcus rhodochrous TaxID=1829 RepID=UPI001E39EC20|nr:TRAP transporter substrate-binding protein DctP [Rhodococcus rhodochrous]
MIPRGKAAAIGVAALLALTTGCSSQADDAPVELVFSDGYSASHPIGKGGSQPFLQYLQENGPDVGLEVERFAPGQLGKPADALHLLRSDAVQITSVIPAYLANSIPLSGVAELPELVPDACSGIRALMPMVQPGGTIFERELAEQKVVPLWGVLLSDYRMLTADHKVAKVEDLRGALIRTPGGVGDRVVRALGASPVSIPVGDIYEAISRGTVEGAVLTRFSAPSYGLEDVVEYVTDDTNLYTTTVLFSVSANQWESLDDQQREVLLEAGRVAQEGACKTLNEAQETAEQKLRDAGVQFVPIDQNNKAEWDAALASVRQNWIDDLESVGLPASAVLAEFESRLAEENQ